MSTITYETKLYTSIGEFLSPLSYEDTMKKIEEGHGILTLERFQISNRVIRDKEGNQTLVDANTKITVRLDTYKCPVLCYEEYHMTDVEKTEVKPADDAQKTEEIVNDSEEDTNK